MFTEVHPSTFRGFWVEPAFAFRTVSFLQAPEVPGKTVIPLKHLLKTFLSLVLLFGGGKINLAVKRNTE